MFGGEFDGVAFDASDLDLPLPGNDPLMHGIIDKHVQTLKSELPEDFLDTIKVAIAHHLSEGDCSMDRIVDSLPYEKRSLQRRLKERGTSYQELLDEIRFDRSIMYLKATDRTIGNISDLLGYKNSSVFSKAFKQKFGVSPKQWRKNCNGGSV
jgi:AraC-like DNA-binding protein